MNMPIPEVNTRHTAKDQTRFAALWRPALVQAFVKLDPRQLKRSPVMLVVALTAVLTTVLCFAPGNGGLVDRRDTFKHLAVTGDHLAGYHAYHVILAQRAGSNRLVTAITLATLGSQALATGLEAVGAGLATAFGQGFGEVGEQHGEPQPHRDLHRNKGGHGGIGHEAQHGGEDGGQFDHQHHRRALQLAWVQLDERLDQRRAPQGRDSGFGGLLGFHRSCVFCRHIHFHIP